MATTPEAFVKRLKISTPPLSCLVTQTNLQRACLSDIKGTPSQIVMVPLSRAPPLWSIVAPLTYISTNARALLILVSDKSVQ
ncbi:hypothetical protein Hypma_002308 [Hypsizygus marmoreus]|uniref:Uncharacterized protein n=1 Tax=Hypsizygus marmoreus TaxID=39966 RepID=A0A369K2P2_HYPMA|nr:hypothetical protein Hypma_002308 [Hypsizygus marmoreus]